MKIPHAVVELDSFVRDSRKLLTPEEIAELIVYLGYNPEAGELIKGTGGFRKLRWARQGMGKSGGTRVIYIYYNETHPLYLARIYAKNAKENVTKAERNLMAEWARKTFSKE